MNLRNYFICLIAIFLFISISPAAFGATEISVSNEASLLAAITTINTAVDAGTADSSYIITVTNNIPLTKRIYFHNAHVTIRGSHSSITITRQPGFSQDSDIARGFFNPGMLEVAVFPDDPGAGKIYQNKDASVTLKNITFNDADNPDNTSMTNTDPASSATSPSTHAPRIYDSILSAYHQNATIILDEGAHLRNPGGWSAIYVTGGATCIMEEKSSITGGKNDSFYLVRIDAANFECSGDIKNNNVRGFIHAHESSIIFDGISDVNNASDHYIYSSNTSIDFDGLIRYTKFGVTSSLIYMTGQKNVDININGNISINDPRDTARTGHILNLEGLHSDVNINGFILSNDVSTIIRCMYSESTIKIGEDSIIRGNNVRDVSLIYVNGTNCVLDIEGLITMNGKSSNENGGAVYLINGAAGFLQPTGEISYHWMNASGGAVYVNTDSTFTMNGGVIKYNTANGSYTHDKLSGDYGGGGVAVSRNGTFIMNDGIIEENAAVVGGGVWVSGKSNPGADGSRFIMNGGTIQNNKLIPPNANVTKGKDVAIVASENGNNSGISSSEINGHYIQISKDAVIGDGFIGISQTSSSNVSNITGYHQSVYPLDKATNNDMFIGTLSQALESDIMTNCTPQTVSYTKIDRSLWIASEKTSGTVNFVTGFPNFNDNEYLVAIAALDNNLDILNSGSQIEIIRPSKTSDGLSIDISVVPSAESYGVVIFKIPVVLTTSYVGDGEFKFQSDSGTSVTLDSSTKTFVDIIAVPDSGWHINSIILTTDDGSVFAKTAVGGIITVNYNELAAGINNIHAVFEKDSSGGGSGSGKANINRGGKLIEDPEIKPDSQKPVIPDVSTPAPIKIVQLWMMAIATFVFMACYRKNDD